MTQWPRGSLMPWQAVIFFVGGQKINGAEMPWPKTNSFRRHNIWKMKTPRCNLLDVGNRKMNPLQMTFPYSKRAVRSNMFNAFHRNFHVQGSSKLRPAAGRHWVEASTKPAALLWQLKRGSSASSLNHDKRSKTTLWQLRIGDSAP